MPDTIEIAKDAIEQFQKVQRHMQIAKEDHADINNPISHFMGA